MNYWAACPLIKYIIDTRAYDRQKEKLCLIFVQNNAKIKGDRHLKEKKPPRCTLSGFTDLV